MSELNSSAIDIPAPLILEGSTSESNAQTSAPGDIAKKNIKPSRDAILMMFFMCADVMKRLEPASMDRHKTIPMRPKRKNVFRSILSTMSMATTVITKFRAVTTMLPTRAK